MWLVKCPFLSVKISVSRSLMKSPSLLRHMDIVPADAPWFSRLGQKASTSRAITSCVTAWRLGSGDWVTLIRRTMGNLTRLGFHPKKMCILRNKINWVVKKKDDALTTRTEESIFVAKRMGVHHHKWLNCWWCSQDDLSNRWQGLVNVPFWRFWTWKSICWKLYPQYLGSIRTFTNPCMT